MIDEVDLKEQAHYESSCELFCFGFFMIGCSWKMGLGYGSFSVALLSLGYMFCPFR